MSDDSLDSLPSPGFVSVFRERPQPPVPLTAPPSPEQDGGGEDRDRSRPVPESVFTISLDDMENDYDLHPAPLASSPGKSSHAASSDKSFNPMEFSSGSSRVTPNTPPRVDPWDDTLPFEVCDTSVVGISRLQEPPCSRPRLSSPSSQLEFSCLGLPQSTPRTHGLPQSTPRTHGLPQSTPRTHGLPQSTPRTHGLPQSTPGTHGLPQSRTQPRALPRSSSSTAWSLQRGSGTTPGPVLPGPRSFLTPQGGRPGFCTPTGPTQRNTSQGLRCSRQPGTSRDRAGVDRDGVDRAAVDRDGVDRDGLDRFGVDRDGMDRSWQSSSSPGLSYSSAPATGQSGGTGPLQQYSSSTGPLQHFSSSTPQSGRQPRNRLSSPALPSPARGDSTSCHTPVLAAVEGEEERLLSVHYCSGHFGAALYSTETCRLDLLTDLPDMAPDYEMIRSLLHQVEPHYVLVSARQDPALLELLRGLASTTNLELSSRRSEATEAGEETRETNLSLVLRPGLEFGLSCGRRRLLALQVPGYRDVASEREQVARLSSFFSLSSEAMVRAAGALLRYLDSALPTGLEAGGGQGGVLLLGSLVMEQILTVDEAAAASLQIFSSSSQLSGSKAGSWNRRREGLSLLNLLGQGTSSVVGGRYMRHLLRCPSSNMQVLQARQATLTFLTAVSNTEVTSALAVSLKHVKNFHRIMRKLAGNTASVSDWRSLHRTLAGLTELAELVPHCRGEVATLTQLQMEMSDHVHDLVGLLDRVIDFQASSESGSLCVKAGVDQELDDKRRQHNGLPDLLQAVAEEEGRRLPPLVKACTVCYIPHVGFLVAMPYKKALEDQGLDFQNIPDFEFQFESNGAMHYRNNCTRSLDHKLGDVMLDITRLEMRVTSQLTELVLDRRASLDRAVSLCGQLDCLLALAVVSRQNNWVQPKLVTSGGLRIRGGRHPLQELSVDQFISNDTELGGRAASLHLITGPNSSGKSVYIKQVGLVVFLAHLGCWVPATSATVPLTDRIFTRIHTVESVSIGMSSFQCDVSQIAAALRSSTPRSLLLVDEFGKGTAPEDGEALLAAVAMELVSRGAGQCPATLLSTHFHGVAALVGPQPLLASYSFQTERAAGGDLTYLYRLQRAEAGHCSEALSVAARAGVEEAVLRRAEQVMEGGALGLQEDTLPMGRIHDLMNRLIDLDVEDEDQLELFMLEVDEIDV